MKPLRNDAVARPRKRRLRKKLRTGEFQECGFRIEILKIAASAASFDTAMDAWTDFVESRSWMFGGGGDSDAGSISGIVSRAATGTLTEEDRLLCERWLGRQEWISSFRVGELEDLWHGCS